MFLRILRQVQDPSKGIFKGDHEPHRREHFGLFGDKELAQRPVVVVDPGDGVFARHGDEHIEAVPRPTLSQTNDFFFKKKNDEKKIDENLMRKEKTGSI